MIEQAPVLVLPQEQLADFERGHLTTYCCAWGESQAFVLGLVPFCGYSDSPNAVLMKKIEALTIEVVALRDIAAGEAILVDAKGNGGSFWLGECKTTPVGAIDSDHPERGCDDRRAREMACRESEHQSLALEARRSALAERFPRQPLSLVLADGVILELVPVPHGAYVVGEDEDPEVYTLDKPQHKRFLDDYFIGKYPVTVSQFAAFVESTGHRTLAEVEGTGWVREEVRWRNVRGADWRHPHGPESDVANKANHPVALVSWDDATAFCIWASRVTGHKVALPSELEWEKAARGTDGRQWPWGSEPPDTTRCNYLNSMRDTTPVGRYSPRGDSPYGCADMAGNVLEWTGSVLRMYPYEDDERRGEPDFYVLRGGAFHQRGECMRCSRRCRNYCRERLNCYGFRVKVLLEDNNGSSH